MDSLSIPARTFVEPTKQSEGKALFFELGNALSIQIKSTRNGLSALYSMAILFWVAAILPHLHRCPGRYNAARVALLLS